MKLLGAYVMVNSLSFIEKSANTQDMFWPATGL